MASAESNTIVTDGGTYEAVHLSRDLAPTDLIT